MPTISDPSRRQPSSAELHALVPLRGLPPAALGLVQDRSDVVRVPRGAHIRQRGRPQLCLLFLLRGEMCMEEADGTIQAVRADEPQAHFPLIPEGRPDRDGVCVRDCELLRLPLTALEEARELAHLLALRAATVAAEAAEASPEERLAQRIRDDFHAALRDGRLQLPGMPDVAVRISAHIDSPQATSSSIARIVQSDPAVTARLIQVANSAAYAPRSTIRTCKDAVTWLGRKAARELVTSFVLKGLFRTRSAAIKTRMQDLWQHSTRVAALCHALARRTPGFEPALAMLMGLVHDIGIIPILAHAHRYPGLAEDAALLDRLTGELRGEVGAMMLGGWGFAPELVTAAEQAEDWQRDPGPDPDYTDLLIVAQLHAFLGSEPLLGLPQLDQVPAFHKLALGALSPRMSLILLDEAQQEIDEVQRMLR
jgi:HD-like signal output (HDOD) protein